MENSIIVENLSKNYSENKAVENINFKIAENEIVGLLGPNGLWKNYDHSYDTWTFKNLQRVK